MSDKNKELGVNQVAQRILLRLKRYIEAQYHIGDSEIIEERKRLLDEPGEISQKPFVEVTPSYQVVDGYNNLNIPKVVRDLLSDLSNFTKPSIGVYSPYKHQALGLEAFFSNGTSGKDLIVATGTGSGKTETFLYSILGRLALEGEERRKSWARSGTRAILLYPMNALVSDQTARLRRLLGDERLSGLFNKKWGRHPTFGMYTSRTPYPGIRKSEKDKQYLDELISYFENLELSTNPENQLLVRELKDRGRWPAKDMVKFYGKALEVINKSRAGKISTEHNWGKRFLTQPGDRELFTRHEMQENAPDLLVTNYSMLEYMLLRPIERSIFGQTKKWLEEDRENRLILILDEAHMYRGVGGAEVAFLIRRLISRLGISRDRLKCIMTSASFNSGNDSKDKVLKFAQDSNWGYSKRRVSNYYWC